MIMQRRCLGLTEKIKIPQVIVVEGKDDTANLQRFYQVDTYETRGSAINEEDLERIEKLHQLRGVIVFTDPDYNGERIRRIIMEAVPTAQHAVEMRQLQSLRTRVNRSESSTHHSRIYSRLWLVWSDISMMRIILTSPKVILCD